MLFWVLTGIVYYVYSDYRDDEAEAFIDRIYSLVPLVLLVSYLGAYFLLILMMFFGR